MESFLVGSTMDPLERVRAILKEGLRETAEDLRKLFHPTQEEVHQLYELMASLADGGRGVH